MADQHFKYIILGAGCAGLSLCWHLLERGVRDPILILDQKEAFTDDRTWCFWNVRPTAFSDLAAHCWHRWDVFDTTGLSASQRSPAAGYACLRGLDFYRHVLARIDRHENVTLLLGDSVESCQSFPDRALVRAGGKTYRGGTVFDSRLRSLPSSGGLLRVQRFFGQFIETTTPCFDPSRCTLMDFRAAQERGLHFFYVLPFSPTEALIENTYIEDSEAASLTAEDYRTEIASYLAQQYCLTRYRVTREETGAIPMTTRRFPKRDGRIFFIGTAGGCTKPSSGYTFVRIQEQCRQIAASIASGTLDGFRERTPPPRYRFFDTVFLQAMQDRPQEFPGHFQRLFARVPPEALTAFLSETGTWQSDLCVIKSLPLGPFLQAVVRGVGGRRLRISSPG